MGFRDHTVTGQISCHHSDIVDLTTLQATQEAAGVVVGVTGDC